MAYKEMVSVKTFWKPVKKGEQIEGRIVSFVQDPKYGLSVILLTMNGEKAQTPSHVALQTMLSECRVGDTIRVTFLGEVSAKDGKSKYKSYRVERDE